MVGLTNSIIGECRDDPVLRLVLNQSEELDK